jgi:hypothetical protein
MIMESLGPLLIFYTYQDLTHSPSSTCFSQISESSLCLGQLSSEDQAGIANQVPTDHSHMDVFKAALSKISLIVTPAQIYTNSCLLVSDSGSCHRSMGI